MERQSVASSLIRSVGYDPAGSILEVELVEPNRVYTFYDVPFSVYDELLGAPSKGKYFNEFIRDLYAYEVAYDASVPPDVLDDLDASDEPE
jgi:KTSC domain